MTADRGSYTSDGDEATEKPLSVGPFEKAPSPPRGPKSPRERDAAKVASSINSVSGAVVDSAMRVHRTLGPGLLESAYQACLVYELSGRGLAVRTQVDQPVHYAGVDLDVAYRIDLIVDEQVIVEVKAVKALHAIHEAQLLSYLKLSGFRLGLLINFHEVQLKDGIRRFVYRL